MRILPRVAAASAHGITVGGEPRTARSRRALALAAGVAVVTGCWSIPGVASAAGTDAALAMEYRPLLRLDRSERWRPLEIEAFLAESNLGSRHRICPSIVVCQTPANRPADLFRGLVLDIAGNDREGRDYRVPSAVECQRPPGVVDCDSGPGSAIYYRLARSAGRVVIDYWWFFRFNDFPRADVFKCREILGVKGCNDHEGDWEGVRVIVTPGAPRAFQVRFDAHGRSEFYEDIPTERVGRRPVVYIAEGTHAAYPRPCGGNYCVQTGVTLPDGGVDGIRSWGRNSAADCEQTCLRPLPAAGWANWPGRWGRKCQTDGCVRAQGPASPRRQAHRRVACISKRTSFRPVSPTRAAQIALTYKLNPKSRCSPPR